jgi:hypothetical protein
VTTPRRTGESVVETGLGNTATAGPGGITLSGCMGFLVRKHALTIDNVPARASFSRSMSH